MFVAPQEDENGLVPYCSSIITLICSPRKCIILRNSKRKNTDNDTHQLDVFLLTTSGVRGFEPRFSPLKELDHVLEPQGFWLPVC